MWADSRAKETIHRLNPGFSLLVMERELVLETLLHSWKLLCSCAIFWEGKQFYCYWLLVLCIILLCQQWFHKQYDIPIICCALLRPCCYDRYKFKPVPGFKPNITAVAFRWPHPTGFVSLLRSYMFNKWTSIVLILKHSVKVITKCYWVLVGWRRMIILTYQLQLLGDFFALNLYVCLFEFLNFVILVIMI